MMKKASVSVLSGNAIDNLGRRLKRDGQTRENVLAIEEYRRSHNDAYAKVTYTLVHELNHEIGGRPSKTTPSIIAKLRRESARLTQIQDIAGCRVVVEGIAEQNRLRDAIEVYLNAKVVDRRQHPSHGYRAVHLIARHNGRSVEIQVRTRLQHMWAEISEKLADTVDPKLKYGGGPEEYQLILRKLSNAIAQFEEEEASRAEALQKLRKMEFVPKPLRRKFKSLESDYSRRRSRLLEIMNDLKELANG